MISSIVKYLLENPQAEAKRQFDKAYKAFRKDLDREAAVQKIRRLNGSGNGILEHNPKNG